MSQSATVSVKKRVPANATEPPSIKKVWEQTQANIETFGVIEAVVVVAALASSLCWLLFFLLIPLIIPIVLMPASIILMDFTVTVYYATGECPSAGMVFKLINRRPVRYFLAGAILTLAFAVGSVLVVPGALILLATPIYTHYVFMTDLDLITCVSKALKVIFRDGESFLGFFGVSVAANAALAASALLCGLPALVV